MSTIANDAGFLALLDAHGGAAADARALGGDLGSARAYALAEEAVIAYIDALLELRTVAAANVVNNALEAQHGRISRMQEALEEIKRATTGRTSNITLLAVHDMAEAGLRIT